MTVGSYFLFTLFTGVPCRLLPASALTDVRDPQLTVPGFFLNIVRSHTEKGKGLILYAEVNVHLRIGVGISSQLLILALSNL